MQQLSISDAAAKVGCGRSTIVRLIATGQLRAVNLGTQIRRIWRINEADLLEFLNGASGVDAAKKATQQSKPAWIGANNARQS